MSKLSLRPKPIVLIMMDGVGVAPQNPGNAVTLADTPNLDKLWPKYPHTYLNAAGINVGLPQGVDGNSEVGHMNVGAGKIVFQELPRIDNAINNGSFNKNKKLIPAFEVAKNGGTVHIIGLLGAGQVHSSYGHLLALLDMAVEKGLSGDQVLLHVFTDGRDSPPDGAAKYLERLSVELERLKLGRIASITGRYYAMDRDTRWERTRKAYELITEAKGTEVKDWQSAIGSSYTAKKLDEYIEQYVVVPGGKQKHSVKPGDSVVFFNFRPDRAVQITQAFEDENFDGWEREMIKDVYFVGMSNYEKGFPHNQAFPPEEINNPVGKVISQNRLRQLRIAESEKFPHVTYFINGRNQTQMPGEDWIEVPSPKDVATYDQKPEMSARMVTDVLIKNIEEDIYDFIVVNYANADMVAHTGVLNASIKAMQIVDECIGRVYEAVMKKNGAIVISADHGNAEEMFNRQTGKADTKHSTNPVPLIIVQEGLAQRELSYGILADIAPTILTMLGLDIPEDMTGRNLLV